MIVARIAVQAGHSHRIIVVAVTTLGIQNTYCMLPVLFQFLLMAVAGCRLPLPLSMDDASRPAISPKRYIEISL